MMRDRHDALSGKLTSNRIDPRKVPFANVSGMFSIQVAVVIIPEQFVQFSLFRMHQEIDT